MEVPQTIEDAIELTKLLGFDYIWVDALCIIQNDAADQQIQINNMHGVYKTAFATIVAASGAHSDAGLPGLRAGTRHYEQRTAIVVAPTNREPGMSLVTSVKSLPQSLGSSWTVGHGDIDTSVWNRRAWTMQEKALSRRTITFSEEQVSWDCPCASFSEEAFFEIRNLRCRSITSTSYQDLTLSSLSPEKSPWDLYRNLVDRFSQRDLSYLGDYNDAFAAIIEMFSDTTGEKFLWALPYSRFNLALSWDTIYGVCRRSAVSKLAMTSLNRQIQFPSWSWLGWVGHAHCSVGTDRTECETPTIVCYTNRSNPLSFLALQDPGAPQDFTPQSQTSSVAFSDVEIHLAYLTTEILSTYADEYLLFFWADTARFLVRPPHQLTFTDHKNVGTNVQDSRPTVHNMEGACIGTACRLKGEHWASATGGFNEQWFDFVAVSRRAVREIPEYPVTIIALQIEWVSGVAYRVNIAEIGEDNWLAARPVRSLIALA
ncbi:hypothetical protein HBI48_025630 [Parastagonospora nodorum]|nr:hypothetical protein HBI48_025630 [Parastagonospora nodorum]